MSTPTESHSGWKVTGQQETRQQDAAGNFVDGVLVMFSTNAGNNGSVFVPATLYNAARVRDLVSQQAALMDGVSALAEEPTG